MTTTENDKIDTASVVDTDTTANKTDTEKAIKPIEKNNNNSEISFSSSSSIPTKLIHSSSYDGNFQLDCYATVIASSSRSVPKDEKGSSNDDDNTFEFIELQLDVTTMHPQGGGQPCDIGTITSIIHHNDDAKKKDDEDEEEEATVLSVSKVTLDRSTGIVIHSGTTIKKSSSSSILFPIGSSVLVKVDSNHRSILSECHSMGHVVDSAMARCQRLLTPTKGYHFLDGPYVEYKGSIPPKERDGLLNDLKAALQDLIEENIPTLIETMTLTEADALCNRLSQNFDFSEYKKTDNNNTKEEEEDTVRIVTIAGLPCPCGGTHIRNTSQLKLRQWNIIGFKSKKGVIRVKYGFSNS